MKLTIFTPTYNRASTLSRLFIALCEQTDKRFEWLIIDDGSTDDTKERVESFMEKEQEFKIRYYSQEHGGKPRAQNRAIDLADGDFFITCDSNKYPAHNAVELILKMANTIDGISGMCGVGGYRADFKGNIWGGEMKIEKNGYVDCTRLEHEKYQIFGDKATAFRTDVLKKYKSPEYQGEDFVSEAVWLLPMAIDGYKTRWFPEILIYGEYAKDGLTVNGANSRAGHEKNFCGFLHLVRLEKKARGIENILYMVYEAIDIAKIKKIPNKEIAKELEISMANLKYIQIKRSYHCMYGKISGIIKKLIGKKYTEKLIQIKEARRKERSNTER